MTTDSNSAGPAGRKPPQFGIGSLIFVVALAVVFFLLGQSMVRHRFFKRRPDQSVRRTQAVASPGKCFGPRVRMRPVLERRGKISSHITKGKDDTTFFTCTLQY